MSVNWTKSHLVLKSKYHFDQYSNIKEKNIYFAKSAVWGVSNAFFNAFTLKAKYWDTFGTGQKPNVHLIWLEIHCN